jgi:hypothetical protein
MICVVLTMFSGSWAYAWDVHADRVVDYWVGPGGWGDPEDVLGRSDGHNWPDGVFETGVGGWIIIEFTDYLAYDGPGYDLRVYAWCEQYDKASVYVSADCESWAFIGTARRFQDPFFEFTPFDFGHDVGLVRFVKVVDDALPEGDRGYRLDSFMVLNGRLIPEPGLTALWFGVPAIGLGARRRRRQALASGPRRTPTTR